MEKPQITQRDYESRISEFKKSYDAKRLDIDSKISDLKRKKSSILEAADALRHDASVYSEQIRSLELDKANAKLIYHNECRSVSNSFDIVPSIARECLSPDGFSSTQKHHLSHAVREAVRHALRDFDNVNLDSIYCEYYTNENGHLAFDLTVHKKD